ncbi:IS1 family transposase [Breznakiellaceae bacterium SP9]
METSTSLICPHCHSAKTVKNGMKKNGSQNYRCKECKKQFSKGYDREEERQKSIGKQLVSILHARGVGIRGIAKTLALNPDKIRKVLNSQHDAVSNKQTHYDMLEVKELWTYLGNIMNKLRLLYVCDRESGEIVAYQWGTEDAASAKSLQDALARQGITYNSFNS